MAGSKVKKNKGGEGMQDDFSKLRSTLQKVDFFYSLSFPQLDELIKVLKKKNVKQGETIITQGDIGDKFYLIASGEVSVNIKKGIGGSKKAATLHDGDFFGETALISDMPRNATIIAEEPTELFVLYKKDFRKILMANPKINHIIQGALLQRKNR
ncbi:MAG: cyclic nucleotide-binding domain-containing protein [Spirochaetia bacterium]|nr:cyclic nucleotide-binding domain-containing protein [Spirochaetia bacterium]